MTQQYTPNQIAAMLANPQYRGQAEQYLSSTFGRITPYASGRTYTLPGMTGSDDNGNLTSQTPYYNDQNLSSWYGTGDWTAGREGRFAGTGAPTGDFMAIMSGQGDEFNPGFQTTGYNADLTPDFRDERGYGRYVGTYDAQGNLTGTKFQSRNLSQGWIGDNMETWGPMLVGGLAALGAGGFLGGAAGGGAGAAAPISASTPSWVAGTGGGAGLLSGAGGITGLSAGSTGLGLGGTAGAAAGTATGLGLTGLGAAAAAGGKGMWGDLLSAGLSLFGQNKQQQAAQDYSNQQYALGQQALEEGRFRPVNVTTRFGQSNWTVDPATGKVTQAGATGAGDVAAMRDRLMQMSGMSLGQAEQVMADPRFRQMADTMFASGMAGMPTGDPTQEADAIFERLTKLQRPNVERGYSGLVSQLQGAGRLGVRGAGAGDLVGAQPEMEAFANAMTQQDVSNRLKAEEMARSYRDQDWKLASGMLGTGAEMDKYGFSRQALPLAQFSGLFGGAAGIEDQILQPLKLGAELGGRNINTNTSAMTQLGGAANQSLLGATQNRNAQFLGMLNEGIKGLFG